MKKELTSVANKFFNSKDIYGDLGVPWKRGLLFHGPPGNGKTISIRALMNSLYSRKSPIPTLYVRDAPYTYDIRQVFSFARAQAPCMLILGTSHFCGGSGTSQLENSLCSNSIV